METATEEVGFEDMGAYVLKRQITGAQNIATQPILHLCEEEVQRPGAWLLGDGEITRDCN